MKMWYRLTIRERLDVSASGEEKIKYELEKIEPLINEPPKEEILE
jgi:hypothetical protein